MKNSSPASTKVYRFLFLGSVALLRPEILQGEYSLMYFQLLGICLFVTYRLSSKRVNSKRNGRKKLQVIQKSS